MSGRFRLPTAIWGAQFQLSGGARRLAWILAIYLVAFWGLVSGIFRFMPDEPTARKFSVVVGLITALQFFIAGLLGSAAIHRALLREADSRMLESHRLTPMGGMTVVFGYLFGPCVLALSLIGLNVVIGGICGVQARLSIREWLGGHALFLSSVFFLWSFAVYLGLATLKPQSAIGYMMLVGFLASALITMVPGLGLLTGFYSGALGGMLMAGSSTLLQNALRRGGQLVDPGLIPLAGMVMVIINMLMGLQLLTLAAAKYRRPDLPAFNAMRGAWFILFTSTIILASLVALARIAGFEEFQQRTIAEDWDRITAQSLIWSLSLASAWMLAAFAVSGVARMSALVRLGISPQVRSDRFPAFDFLVLTFFWLMAAAVAGGLSMRKEAWPMIEDISLFSETPVWSFISIAWGITAVSLACTLIFTYSLYSAFPRWSSKVCNSLWGIYFSLLWIAPVGIEQIWQAAQGHQGRGTFSEISGASPVGSLVLAWTGSTFKAVPGLLLQAGLAVIALIVLATRRHRDQAAPILQRILAEEG